MPLTPEQFNKITTKDEFNELKADVKKIDGKIDKLLDAVEGLTTQHKKFDLEMVSNQGAHDRFEEPSSVIPEAVGCRESRREW